MDELLKQYRDQIDSIDAQVLQLINQRAKCAQKIGEIKGGGVIYRPEREAQVLRRIQELNTGPLENQTVAQLFREIMSACLSLEQPLSIGYLGPEGSFTQLASQKHFGLSATYVPCRSIDDVVAQVTHHKLSYGVVPVENSTEGSVNRTLDLMLNSPLKICGEVMLPIHQNLMSKESSLSEIKKVYGHAQSLAQCNQWLNEHLPNAERISVVSNSESARLASLERNTASLGSITASEFYGLNVLFQEIEDEADNTTRFWALGHHDSAPSGKDKTSLVMSSISSNESGALFKLLQPLANHKINMTKLESRPSRLGGLWEYVFFVDLEGHFLDENLANALDEIKKQSGIYKVLGSYPIAVF